MTAPAPTAAPEAFASEWDLFRRLLPAASLDERDPKAPQAVYTPFVLTWLLVYQRLHGNATLNDAVAELVVRFGPSALPGHKRVREGSLSANSGAYAAARGKLPPDVLRWAATAAYDSLVDSYGPSWQGRRAFVLDGSTLRLASDDGLRQAYPPASNQNGPSPWPILHLAVAHELRSALAVLPEFGPMYGPAARSELSLALGLLGRLPKGSILLADRNFGVFAFAWAAASAGHDSLLRLTQPRFKSLRKRARPDGSGRWRSEWRPSRWDRRSHPQLPQEALVRGWLHEVKVSPQLTLWLFTTLDAKGPELAGLYRKRQNVETDIRDLKETLALGEVSGRSEGMVGKELVAGVLAYNLANQVRRLAAERAGVEPRRLSFAGVMSLLKAFLSARSASGGVSEAQEGFERVLRAAAQRKLPERAEGRSSPRKVLGRRRKFPVRNPLSQHPSS